LLRRGDPTGNTLLRSSTRFVMGLSREIQRALPHTQRNLRSLHLPVGAAVASVSLSGSIPCGQK
jgi:hypothetical protein